MDMADSHCLPADVYDKFPEGVKRVDSFHIGADQIAIFPSLDAALSAASDAWVAWGRELAGLGKVVALTGSGTTEGVR